MLGGGVKDGWGYVDAKADRKTSSESRSEIENILDKSLCTWNGGDPKFHRKETLKNADKKNEWRMSTFENPGMMLFRAVITCHSCLISILEL